MSAFSGLSDPQRPARVEAIMRAVSEYDLTQSDAWADLDALSTHTYVENLEVDPEGVVIDDDRFKGIMNVYVLLQYGPSNQEGFQTSDAFRAWFDGHFQGQGAIIDRVKVDISPFYAGETA
jgi:hypothetical protein